MATIDDYQPRSNLRALFAEKGGLNEAELKQFSDRFAVSCHVASDYLQHLQHLNLTRNMRSSDRKEQQDKRKKKVYRDYNWGELLMTGRLDKLLVSELDKYLDCHHISKTKKNKKEKVLIIQKHLQLENTAALERVNLTGAEFLAARGDVSDDGTDDDESTDDEDELVQSTASTSCSSSST